MNTVFLILSVVSLFSAEAIAAPIQFQCGDNAQLFSVKNENLTVDLTYQFKDLPKAEAAGSVRLASDSYEMADLVQLTRYALMQGVDPYVMMGLFVSEKGRVTVDGLGAARLLDCNLRPRSELKITRKTDSADVGELNERLRKLTVERNGLSGGDDFDEWMDSQKEIEKQLRLIDGFKVQLKKEKGEKRAEIQDQIIDAQEEIKGLQKEQEQFTKTPVMKKIAAIETERYQLRSQIEGLRQQAEARASGADAGIEFNKDWECLKSEKCVGVLLKNEKPKDLNLSDEVGSSATAANALVCLEGDLLKRELSQFTSAKGVCCAQVKAPAGRKALVELKYAAAARQLRENFMDCAVKDTVAKCLGQYFDFKGECAPEQGFKVTAAILSELVANPQINTMVGVESQRLKKPILSAFCSSQKKSSFAVDHTPLLEEAKKFADSHKTCTKK